VNPDGVIIGNHRTNAKGYDLNRHYDFELNESNQREMEMYPELVHVKRTVQKCHEERGIVFMGDFHGHK
jgi:murein tripeptide amidase MpaA